MPAYSLLPSLNYPGSSRYSVPLTSPMPGARPPGTPDPAEDYPVMNAAGMVVSKKTGQPFTGTDPFGSGVMYRAGKPDTSVTPGVPVPGSNRRIDPNDPTQRYQPVNIQKDPSDPTAAATNNLIAEFQKGAGDALKGFDQHLADFTDQARNFMTASKAATDIAPVETAMRGNQTKYSAALGQSASDLANLNTQDAATQRGLVARDEATLPQYDTALTNAEAIAQGGVDRAGKAAMIGRGFGSDIASLLASESYRQSVPIELAKIAARQNMIQNVAMPAEARITGLETNRITQFDPMVAGQQYQTAQQVEQGVQQLKVAAANQDWQTFQDMLQVPALQAEVRNRILAGDTTLLGALQQLRAGSKYQSLQDVLGANLSQPVGYNMGTPGYPAPSRYSPGGAPPVTSTSNSIAPNAPITVDPNAADPSQVGNLSLGPGNRFYPTRYGAGGAYTSLTPYGGNVNLPLDYQWGRSPDEQAAFENVQSQYQ